MKLTISNITGLAIIALAIYAYFKFKKPKSKLKRKQAPKQRIAQQPMPKATNPSNTQLVFDPSLHENISSLQPIERAMFAEVYDHLFEVEKWQTLMPKQSFNPNWMIQMEPASRNTPIRFKVWNKAEQAAVKVIFDPYGIHTNLGKPHWQVTAPMKKTIHVPMDDATQLRATIANYLQQISPINHDEEE